MEIQKGEQYSIDTAFKRRGQPVAFNNPPIWTLYDSDDVPILSGPAENVGSRWVATFTIPERYIVPDGKETLTLQFVAYDSTNHSFTQDREITLVDVSETYMPTGVVYNAITKRPVKDSLSISTESADQIVASVYSPAGQLITTQTLTDQEFSTRKSIGYQYDVEIDLSMIPDTIRFNDPYQIVYECMVNGVVGEEEIHPLYILDSRTLSIVNYLSQTLDKARLTEIDPSLQWQLPEYIQAAYEGVKYINASEPEGTFWTMRDYPSTLTKFVQAAALVQALNSRGIAEGLNAFDFTGLNTSLNFNRADYLTGKLDEAANYLEKLPQSKKSAIRIAGKGQAGVGETDNRKRNLGMLGLSQNRLNNRRNFGGLGRSGGVYF